MIRFVDIRDNGTGYRFAYFDTSCDKFLSFDGEQVFSSFSEVQECCYDKKILIRLRGITPEWAFDNKNDNVVGWYMKE